MSVYVQTVSQNRSLDDKNEVFSSSEIKTFSKNDNAASPKDISVNVSKDLVAAAGFNVETPIVNAIIGNITGILPTKKNEATETVKCEICDCEITSSVILAYHINGSRHRKKLKALDIIAQLKEEKGVLVDNCDSPNAFRCEICCLTVNSAQQLEFHLSGAKHKKKVAKSNLSETDSKNMSDSADESASPPHKKKKKEEPKILTCAICNIFMNSQTQYDQHLASRKHKIKSNRIYTSRKNWTANYKHKNFIKLNSGSMQSFNSNVNNSSNITFQSNQYNCHSDKKKCYPYSHSSNSHHFFKHSYFSNYKYSSEHSPFNNYSSQNITANLQVRNNFNVGRSQLF